MAESTAPTNLAQLSRELLEKARGLNSGRAATGIYSGAYLRQALLTLTSGSELAEHDSPPEATIQVVQGSVRLATAEESWDLATGEHIAIPPARHSVTALEDAAFILTIRMDIG